MTPADAHAEALRRIAHARESAAEMLDLGDLPLDQLPDALGELPELRILALGRSKPLRTESGWKWEWERSRPTQHWSNVSALAGLHGLQSLNLAGCEGVSDVSALAGLRGLQSLDLAECEGVSDVSALAGLHGLQSLNLYGCNRVSDVSALTGLHGLQSLNLTSCKGVSDVSALAGLHGLQSLDLSWCEGVSDVSALAGLHGLQSLGLKNTDVSDVSALAGLHGLQSLDLESTGVSDVSALAGLHGLQSLELTGCVKIEIRQIEPLWDTLDVLVLYQAQCRDFPSELCGTEYGENVLPAVRAYFQDLGTDPAVDAECKVYLLGNGRVGKTKLARRLRGLDYGDEHEKTTHGVRLSTHSLTVDGLPHTVRVNLWDFGGQDIYHGSHALFCRGPAVFLLLWAPDCENDDTFTENGIPLRNRQLPYWFDYLRDTVGENHHEGRRVNSPILLIQSQCDDRGQKQTPPVPLDHDGFPELHQLHVSAMTDYNLADVCGDLAKAVRYLFDQFPRPKLGPGWVRVRDAIRERQNSGARTMTTARFEVLCREGAGGVSDPAVLLRFLHQSGVVFHQPSLFGGQIILDQQWALDAIYTVFDRDKVAPYLVRDGRFTEELLAATAWPKHTPEERATFLGMMEQCGIIFKARQLNPGEHPEKYEYIAPEWLPEFEAKRSVLQSKLDTPADAEAVARFAFLHDGIARTFLARVGQKAADDAIYWKYGFWFRAEGSEVLARVEEGADESGPAAGRVIVQAWGPTADKLVSAVLETLDAVATGAKPTVERTGGRATPLPERLVDEPTIITGRGVEGLHTVGGPAPAGQDDREVFISYAWGDDSAEGRKREQLVLDMVGVLHDLKYVPLYDKQYLRPGDAISDYMKKAGQTARVVAIVSEKYLRSEFCMTEVYAAFRTCDFDPCLSGTGQGAGPARRQALWDQRPIRSCEVLAAAL